MTRVTVDYLRFVLPSDRSVISLTVVGKHEMKRAKEVGYLLLAAYTIEELELHRIDSVLAVVAAISERPILAVASMTEEHLVSAVSSLLQISMEPLGVAAEGSNCLTQFALKLREQRLVRLK